MGSVELTTNVHNTVLYTIHHRSPILSCSPGRTSLLSKGPVHLRGLAVRAGPGIGHPAGLG